MAVNDGSRFAEIHFQVTVLAPEPINVEIEGDVFRVVDESTTLNGMTITQLEGEPMLADLNLGKLDAAVARHASVGFPPFRCAGGARCHGARC